MHPTDAETALRAASVFSDNATKKEDEAAWTILSDWKVGSDYGQRLPNWEHMLPWLSDRPLEMDNAEWRKWVTRFCPEAPEHILSPAALTQANEAAHFLHISSRRKDSRDSIAPRRALMGLSFALAKAAATGRKIRSIGFVVRSLEEPTSKGDFSWAYDFPTKLPKQRFGEAATDAHQLVAMLGVDFPLDRRELLGTDGIEAIAYRLERHGRGAVFAGIQTCVRDQARPEENGTVIGWSWFDRFIAKPGPSPKPAMSQQTKNLLNQQAAEQRALIEALNAPIRQAIGPAMDRLEAAGIVVKRNSLSAPAQIGWLRNRLGNRDPASALSAAVALYIANPKRKPKVWRWSNLSNLLVASNTNRMGMLKTMTDAEVREAAAEIHVQRDGPHEGLRRAHELSRKKRGGSYDDQLEADVRAAHEVQARGRDGRPKADKDKASEDIETLVRRAAAEVAEKKRAPNMQNLRRMARESGTTWPMWSPTTAR